MKLLLSIVGVLAVLAVLAVQQIECAEIQTRVIGQPVQGGAVYALAVITPDNKICTATLIDPLWALTSAGCITRSKRVRVIYQKVPKPDYNAATPIKDFYIYPTFNPGTLLNDIALIQLITPAPSAWVPLEIPAVTDLFTGGVVYGYGHETGTLQLYQASVTMMANAACQQFTQMHNSKVCTRNSLSCDGDQGGPLVSGNKLVGVVSIEERQLLLCSTQNPFIPMVIYTRVAMYKTWIKDVTKLNYL